MHVRQRAFTLVELLLVIGVSGVVGALALSAYRTYAVRAEVEDGLGVARTLTPHVVAAFRRLGEAPAAEALEDLPLAALLARSAVVAGLSVADGRVDVVYGRAASGAIAGKRLSLTPYESADLAVVWVCGNEIPGPGLMPLGFSGGGRQSVQVPATVEARYLPAACR
jgi:type IV pilus assembly protein PilA